MTKLPVQLNPIKLRSFVSINNAIFWRSPDLCRFLIPVSPICIGVPEHGSIDKSKCKSLQWKEVGSGICVKHTWGLAALLAYNQNHYWGAAWFSVGRAVLWLVCESGSWDRESLKLPWEFQQNGCFPRDSFLSGCQQALDGLPWLLHIQFIRWLL